MARQVVASIVFFMVFLSDERIALLQDAQHLSIGQTLWHAGASSFMIITRL